LPNNKFIGKNILKGLININKDHDLKISYKISDRHLLVEGTSWMNVKLAAQTFSNYVSKAIAFREELEYFNLDNWKDVS